MQKLSPSSYGEDTYKVVRSKDIQWPPQGLDIFCNIAKPSNQHFEKRASDGVLQGMLYAVTPEPSTLRPIRAWRITIEEWSYADVTQIEVRDVLSIRIVNEALRRADLPYQDVISDLFVRGDRMIVTPHSAFNSLMAAAVIMTKIDAGRLPNLNKIMASYQLD